jgi:predicted aspartyl protease
MAIRQLGLFRMPRLLLLGLLALTAAQAQACVPRRLAELAVTLDRGVPLLPVSIDGRRALLVLDTGAERTILSTQAAARLGMQSHHACQHAMRGVGGRLMADEEQPDRMAACALALTGYSLLVAPIAPTDSAGRPLDGLPWPTSCSTIAAHSSLHRHLSFPVLLDGHAMAAVIDAGAGLTTVDAVAATSAGATAAALRRDKDVTVQGVAGPASGAHLHRFASLGVAGEAVAGPLAIVIRLDLDDAVVVMGGDFLATHRVWLSYGAPLVSVAPRG